MENVPTWLKIWLGQKASTQTNTLTWQRIHLKTKTVPALSDQDMIDKEPVYKDKLRILLISISCIISRLLFSYSIQRKTYCGYIPYTHEASHEMYKYNQCDHYNVRKNIINF